MFISRLTDSPSTTALTATMRFNHERLKMLAENVANTGTPNYRSKQLDAVAFRKALGQAIERKRQRPHEPLSIRSGREVATTRDGRLVVTPSTSRPQNVRFHDGTDQSLETQMAQLAETAMTQRLATELLSGKVAGMRKAIRGTV